MDNALVKYGEAVKATGNGIVGGYLVRFTTADDTDLAGDFFTKDTDFSLLSDLSLTWYAHGLDPVVGKKHFAPSTLKTDDVGIWAEVQLDLRNRYERAIYGMAESQKMGWSSGAPGHLVEKEQVKDAYWIKTWPLGTDASLTPAPCEPRNMAMPMKSLQFEPLVDVKSTGFSYSDKCDLIRAELRRTQCEMDGYCWAYICDLYDKTFIYKIETEDGCETFEAPYTIDRGVVTIGESVPVVRKTVYEATAKGLPFADHSQSVLAAARELAQRARDVKALRAEDGRDIASARIRELHEIADELKGITAPALPDDVMLEIARNELALSTQR